MAEKMTEREKFYYEKGKKDFAKEAMEKIGCIKTRCGIDYDNGVHWAVCKILWIIMDMVGDSDGRD